MTNKEEKAKSDEKSETSGQIIKDIEKSGVSEEIAKKEEKLDEKAAETKKPAAEKQETEEKKPEKKHAPEKTVKKPKKTEAVVNARDVPISTKHSAAICRFIKRKKISRAISDLEEVVRARKAVPMRGEIPHRKGKMMSGRFPQKAAREFIVLLKSLGANANYNGIEDPIVTEAKANIGARPFGRYGIRRKRTHVTLAAKTATAGGKK